MKKSIDEEVKSNKLTVTIGVGAGVLMVLILSLALWYLFGLIIPTFLIGDIQDTESLSNLSLIGGAFGGASALFSGLALFLLIISVWLQGKELSDTRLELKKSAKAQAEMAELESRALALQIIMPFMDEISSVEMREAIIKLADFKRKNENFALRFEELVTKRKGGTLSNSELEELNNIDDARRKFVMIFHRMFKLKATDVVDEKIIKVVIGPDHAHLLLENVEPLEAKIRKNYARDIFEFAESLYTEKERKEKGSHD